MNLQEAVGTVVILHMTNGQPVVGRLQEYDADNNGVTIYKAMELNFMQHPSKQGAVSVQFTPFLAFGGILPPLELMPLDLADMLFVRAGAQVPKQIEDGYLQATSGIALASSVSPTTNDRAFSLVKP